MDALVYAATGVCRYLFGIRLPLHIRLRATESERARERARERESER